MSDKPVVSVIILNFNGKKYLDRCLTSLKECVIPGGGMEVMVVDNGSSDGSVEYLQQHHPWARIVPLGENLGWAEGNNRGAIVADGNHLIFLNNDTEVHPRMVSLLVERMMRDHRIGAAGPLVMDFHRRDTIGTTGCYWSTLGLTGAVGKGERAGTERTTAIFAPSGVALAVEKDAFFRCGGFDPAHFLYCEEVDLCWRMYSRGLDCEVVPEAIVYHIERGSPLASERYVFYQTRNRLLVLIKNERRLLFRLMVAVAVTVGQSLALLLRGRRPAARATLRGVKEALLSPMLNGALERRRKNILNDNAGRRMLGPVQTLTLLMRRLKRGTFNI